MMEEIKSNEFYVCLLSDGSPEVYKTNIQSTFTNLLRAPCNLNEKWQVGLSEIYLNGYKSSAIKQSVNTESSDMLIVYTDIIKPRYIESLQVRYLRVLPNASKERHIRFSPIEYCQLENNYIQSISIMIANRQGEAVAFNDSKIPTYVMLHFKKENI